MLDAIQIEDLRRRALEGVKALLEFIGEDVTREGLIETPHRVVKAWEEMCSGYKQDPKTILSKSFTENYNELVIVKDIEFTSQCEHHLLGFSGTATVGYIPNGKVVGLSKIPRLVQCFAKRLQLQERMTQQIAQALQEGINPKGVGVVVQASHSCMKCRGIKSSGSMVTSCLLGCFMKDKEVRSEFLSLVRHTLKDTN